MHSDAQPLTPPDQEALRQAPANAPVEPSAEILATSPGQHQVIRRNGKVTGFDSSKIAVAITKAFLAVEGGSAAA
ncbi:hypothetical protein V6O07_13730, partial [Arthrospira platensis SPKY2]